MSNNLVVVTGAKKDSPPAEGFAGFVAIASGLSLPFADGRYERKAYRIQLHTDAVGDTLFSPAFLTPLPAQSVGVLHVLQITRRTADARISNVQQLRYGLCRGASGLAAVFGGALEFSSNGPSGGAGFSSPSILADGENVTVTVVCVSALPNDVDLFCSFSCSAVL